MSLQGIQNYIRILLKLYLEPLESRIQDSRRIGRFDRI